MNPTGAHPDAGRFGESEAWERVRAAASRVPAATKDAEAALTGPPADDWGGDAQSSARGTVGFTGIDARKHHRNLYVSWSGLL